MSVLVVVETFNGSFKKAGLEAVSYSHEVGKMLAMDSVALVIGKSELPGSLGKQGAHRVIYLETNEEVCDSAWLSNEIASAAVKNQSKVIVLVHNSTSKSIVGRLAIKLKGSCASGVTSLPKISGDQFEVSRFVFAGKATAHLSLSGACKILSLTSNLVPVKNDGQDAIVEIMEKTASGGKVSLIETQRITGHVPLPEAERVVSAGRGMKDPSNWGIVETLAKELNATLACSRPVADAGWRPHHEHVGQTGLAIKPNLYIAIGISGAIQHLAGVNNSKVIIVINKDPEAPFFKAADYGVCGDLFEVVPRLIDSVRKFKQAHS